LLGSKSAKTEHVPIRAACQAIHSNAFIKFGKEYKITVSKCCSVSISKLLRFSDFYKIQFSANCGPLKVSHAARHLRLDLSARVGQGTVATDTESQL
jgi:hypothetical protein